jgi:hypothetical protein
MRPNKTFKHLYDQGFRPFRHETAIFAKQMDIPFEVHTPEGLLRGEAGDYWCVGPRNQQWPLRATEFEECYKPTWHVSPPT